MLTGSLAAKAEENCRAVARQVVSGYARESADPRQPAIEPGLSNGIAGLAVAASYFDRRWPDDGHRSLALDLLDAAIRRLSEEDTDLSLFAGFPGVAWAAEHLRVRLDLEADEDASAEVDAALQAGLARKNLTIPYDLVGGLVGLAVYALELGQRAGGRELLDAVLGRLFEVAVESAEGTCWWTDPRFLSVPDRETFPRGWYNLGVAHGVPGVVSVLGRSAAAGGGGARTAAVLTDAVRWLLSRASTEEGPAYGYYTGFGIPSRPSRSAWCYGDPGVAVALLSAARRTGNTDWEREAVALGLRSASRPPGEAEVADAGLCHGAAGLAHIFNRLYQATGLETFREAAVSWFERTLDFHRPGTEAGGFPSWVPGNPGSWVPDPAVLTGSAGVALALLSGFAPIEPEWDRFMLMS